MLCADKYNSFICVCNYNILEQRNYLTIFTDLKYDASIQFIISSEISQMSFFSFHFLLTTESERKFNQLSLFKDHLFFIIAMVMNGFQMNLWIFSSLMVSSILICMIVACLH